MEERKQVKEELKTEETEKEQSYQEEAKRRGVIDCLYNHLKNTPKKLKVVCDWDEVIQPLEPKVYYELSEREGAYYDAP
jgi:transposase